MEMTWSGIFARRIARQGLADPVPIGRAAEQVGVICGAHAQVMSAAELAIALRVEGMTQAGVRDALWTAALSTLPTQSPRFPDHVRLTPEQTDELVTAIGSAQGSGTSAVRVAVSLSRWSRPAGSPHRSAANSPTR